MKRVLQWERELRGFLIERRDMPFAWGTNDCASFSAEWLRRCTGQTLFTPDYADAQGAARRLAQGMREQVSAVLGPMRTDIRSARRGDVGLVPVGDREALGVVEGRYVASPGERGLVLNDRLQLIVFWEV